MHRHQKLDIFFITQQSDEIDAQIRRYCNQLYICKGTYFYRKHIIDKENYTTEIIPIIKRNLVFTKYKMHTEFLPFVVKYEEWKNPKLYDKYLNGDITLKPKHYGAVKRLAFINNKIYTKYNTYQQDTESQKLPMLPEELHNDPNELINTSI